ncbi:translocation/assembly module TamB domain-containing protein [uncultured Microbulbifer sp.]|uniref:translocation/assembly module TamB domain-containing protein n=1 Tax=uncultured Microbulbifer sp. TaxID=348147 RepID=UPI0025ECCF93|nr:translocation/assembly module TamB [uncultured Microbulbifer sp.]
MGAERRSWFRLRWPRLTAIALAVLIPLLLLVFLVGSESGRVALTRGGIAIAGHFLPDLEIAAEGLASREFGHWYFSHLSVRYRDKPMVEGREVSLKVDLHRLLRNQVHVAEVTASSLLFDNTVLGDYLAAHVSTEEVAEAAEETSGLNIPAIWVEQLAVDSLTVIDRQLPGFPVLAVKGQGSYRWPGAESGLELSVDEHGGSALQVRLSGVMQSPDRYLLEFSASENAGGFVTGKLQLPQGQNLDADGRVVLDIRDEKHLTATVERFSLPLVDHRFGLTGAAAITLAPWAVTTDGLILTADDSRHRIAGSIDGEAVALEVKLNKLPVAISQPWQDYLQGGWLSADVDVRGPLALPEVNGTLELKSSYQKQPLQVTGEVQTREKVIQIKTARVKLAGARVDASGEVDIAGETIDLEGLVEQLPLEKVREILAALEETRDIAIPPEVDANIGRLAVSAEGSWRNPKLDIKLDGSVDYQELSTEVHGAASGDLKQFAVNDILVEGEGVRVSGSGTVGIDAKTLQFQLDVAARDLQPAEQLGLPVDPGTRVNLDAVVAVTGPWDNPQMSAQISSRGTYRDYRYRLGGGVAGNAEKLTLDRLRLDLLSAGSGDPASTRDQSLVAADPSPPEEDYPLQAQSGAGIGALAEEAEQAASRGNAWLEVNGVVELKARRANGSIAGRNIPVTLAELAGVALPPSLDGEISIDGQFSGPFTAPEVGVNVLGLGSFRGEPWQIQGDIHYASGSVQLADVNLLWAARNQLTANGNLSADTLELDLRAKATLADFEEWIAADISDSGELTLWATAKGSPKAPVLAGELKLTGRAPAMRDDALVQAPLNLVLGWQTADGKLNAKLDASHGARRAAEASLTLAIAPILEQLFAERAEGVESPPLPLDLEARGEADLQALSAFFDPEIHSMRGVLAFDMLADGNTRSPNMRGRINLRDGYYEHRPTNTRLRNLVFVAELTPEQWRIVEAGASDRDRGRIDLDGAMTFRAPDAPSLDFVLRAREAHLLNMPGARGAFSGELTLTGSTDDALLAGTLNLRPLAVQVEHFLGSSVPEIDVIEVEVDDSRQQQGPSILQNIALALRIVLKEQSYVRGLGLDSELKGQVDIGGTAASPQPSGSLTIVRGKFDLLGKKFELQEGQVQFENMVAAIYVKGVHTYPEGEITAEISGTTDDLKVEFSSSPAAAQDEIFAQLLFGKSLTDISPLQAVRLVTVVRTLQSGGTGFDPVAKTRELIGLDTLDVETEETDEGDQYSLSLGKYITSRIYLELQRSTDPLNPWQAEMQIELRKNLRLEIKSSDSNETSAGSIELQWKKDY